VKWIWFGGIVVVLGTGLAMFPSRGTALVLRPIAERAWGESVAPQTAPARAPIRRSEGHD